MINDMPIIDNCEQALNWFKEELKEGKCSDNCPQCNANEFAIKALEKHIPKKPNLDKMMRNVIIPSNTIIISCDIDYYKCPICGNICGAYFNHSNIKQTKYTPRYCQYCGQAFDWSDVDLDD